MADIGTPRDKILALLEALSERLAKVEAVILDEYAPDPEPQKTGGLYDFVRPVPVEPRYGAGMRMTAPAAADGPITSAATDYARAACPAN